ncbi:DNA polymerase Y family protein [Marinobacter sp. R17]|uniref:Y-family DNA polymerase n=1 Tax=Marinobacter sp. R17 TaxID=2484250 RepID=UPI000F4BF6DC|nr:DNA polymerase Y family protein [Marinobacter sp. R17]ROT99526.1 DNA polymerase Y family protein [Marinobacter sp. R17]
MLWLYLHFPYLLLEHFQQSETASRPMALIGGHPPRIIQLNPEAARAGVAEGQSPQTASALADNLHLIAADMEEQTGVLDQQAVWLYRHAARIILYPPDGILAEAGSLRRLHGGLQGLWKKLRSELDQRRLTAHLACGLTPRAARILARDRRGHCTDDAQTLRQSLDTLPVEAADLDEKTTERLQRMGLHTLGPVLALPDRELARRLGPETAQHLQQIEGRAVDPQTDWQPPPYFHRRLDFAEDVEHSSGLLFPLQRALQELDAELCWRQQQTDTLQLEIRHRRRPVTPLQIRSTAPEHRANAFLELARLKLDRHQLEAPATGLSLKVRRFLDRHTPRGDDLFGDTGQHQEEARQHLLSRLQARLGEEALHSLALNPDHRPEQAWRATPVSSGRPSPARTAPRRPLWLLRQPQPLREMPCTWLAGPERISAGWWDGERIQRDYYIARLHSGQTGWLFRDVSGGWFIHGWFG